MASMASMGSMGSGKRNWVRAWEHPALSFFSVVFAAVSAHAILWFYSSLDVVHMDGSDFMQPFIKWGLAAAFTGFGYLSSRGLAHRLLRGERVGVYFLICIVLELVEIIKNFMYSAVAIRNVAWLQLFTGTFHTVLMVLMYVVLPIVPIVTVVLAWVDMDLTRQKEGPTPIAQGGSRAGYASPLQSMTNRTSTRSNGSASPYANGYTGVPRMADGGATSTRQGGFRWPFRDRDEGREQAQPKQTIGVRTMLLDPEKQMAPVE
jgi:hypothetical protein